MTANNYVYTSSLNKWSKTRSEDITLSLFSLCFSQEPLFELSFLFNFYYPVTYPNIFVLNVIKSFSITVCFVIQTLVSMVKFTLHRPH